MTIDKLHDKARRAIDSGEKAFSERAREAAEYLAEARKLGAKQQESANAIGKSAAWVNALLKWRDGDYKTACPFPRATRTRIQPAERRKRARPPTSSEEARAQTAKANAERAKADAQKAKAEAAKARAEAKKARSENARAQAEARRAAREAFAGIFGDRRPETKVHSGPRELLIKALGMLGSDHAGERANAALVVEKQRARLGMTWEDLIVPADEVDSDWSAASYAGAPS
jgi:hypothetical protein